MDRFDPGTSCLLSAHDARSLIEQGLLTSRELVASCLARIDELEPTIGAWAHLDREHALSRRRLPTKFARAGCP